MAKTKFDFLGDSGLGDILKQENGGGWTPVLLLVCLASTFGTAIPVGYFLGVMNTPAEHIKIWCNEALISRYNFHLNDAQIDVLWASIVSIFLIGGIIGSLVGAACCDKYGRKGCLHISGSLLLCSGFLFNFCREVVSVEMLMLGRLLAGIAAALIYTAHPMYLMEIAPIELRGSVGVFTAIGVTGGICIGQIFSLQQIFGTASEWHYALSFYTLFVVLGFMPFCWFPESPRWLHVVNQNVKAARIALERLRGSNADSRICNELLDMEVSARSSTKNMNFRSVLSNKELLLPLVLVCSFQVCQQLSGINAIFFYSVPIFTKAGFSAENAAWMNLGAGFLNAVCSLMGPWLMSKFNRRPLMILSCVACTIALFGIAFGLNYIDRANWLPLTCITLIALYIFFFQFGLGPIPYFIGSELFEVTPRPIAMSMGSLFSWGGNFMIGMFFPILQGVIGSYAFIPCAIVCIYCCLLAWFYLPESRGIDASDLSDVMKNGFKSKVKLSVHN